MLQQFVSQFNDLSKNDQYRVLTSLPKEESRESIQSMFGVSDHTAKRAKTLQNEHGIFSTPSPKIGKRISEETIDLVKDFFEKDYVTRQMPGKKDFVTIKENGEKQRVQKRQILRTVYEAFL